MSCTGMVPVPACCGDGTWRKTLRITIPHMVTTSRTFKRLGLVSLAGLGFYYAHLFLGMVYSAWLFRALAVCFLMATVPLPIIAVNDKKLFPALEKPLKRMLALGAMLLLVHHFLMTFIFVMFLPEGRVF